MCSAVTSIRYPKLRYFLAQALALWKATPTFQCATGLFIGGTKHPSGCRERSEGLCRVLWLERATCWAQPPSGHGCSALPGPGRPPHRVASPGNLGCCRHRGGSPPCSLMGALGREGWGVSRGNETAKSRPQFFIRLTSMACVHFHRYCSLPTAKWDMKASYEIPCSGKCISLCVCLCEHPTKIIAWFASEGTLKII